MSKFRHQIPEVSALRALLLNHHREPPRPATNLDAIKAHKGPSNHIKVYKACEAKPTHAKPIRPYPTKFLSKHNHLGPHFVPTPSVPQCLCGAIPSSTRQSLHAFPNSSLLSLFAPVQIRFTPVHGISRPIRPYPTKISQNICSMCQSAPSMVIRSPPLLTSR